LLPSPTVKIFIKCSPASQRCLTLPISKTQQDPESTHRERRETVNLRKERRRMVTKSSNVLLIPMPVLTPTHLYVGWLKRP